MHYTFAAAHGIACPIYLMSSILPYQEVLREGIQLCVTMGVVNLSQTTQVTCTLQRRLLRINAVAHRWSNYFNLAVHLIKKIIIAF